MLWLALLLLKHPAAHAFTTWQQWVDSVKLDNEVCIEVCACMNQKSLDNPLSRSLRN